MWRTFVAVGPLHGIDRQRLFRGRQETSSLTSGTDIVENRHRRTEGFSSRRREKRWSGSCSHGRSLRCHWGKVLLNLGLFINSFYFLSLSGQSQERRVYPRPLWWGPGHRVHCSRSLDRNTSKSPSRVVGIIDTKHLTSFDIGLSASRSGPFVIFSDNFPRTNSFWLEIIESFPNRESNQKQGGRPPLLRR